MIQTKFCFKKSFRLYKEPENIKILVSFNVEIDDFVVLMVDIKYHDKLVEFLQNFKYFLLPIRSSDF